MVASDDIINGVIQTFAQATEANLSTPSREGNAICLTDERADELMVTGDLHGQRRNFNLICRAAALDQHARRHLLLQEVCHGGPTYPANGGCMSHLVLEEVAKLKVRYPDRVHFILGNHELSEISDYPIQKAKQMLNLQFRLGLQQMYGPAAARVRDACLEFLRSCPLAVRLSSGVFISHSIPQKVDSRPFDKSLFSRELDPVEYYEQGDLFELVWGRDYREENARAFAAMVGAKVLITGHEPCSDGYAVPNQTQVILDCCSDKACYVVLPVGRPLSQAEIVERIEKLG